MGKKIILLVLITIFIVTLLWLIEDKYHQIFSSFLNWKKESITEKNYKIGVVMTGGAYQQALDGLKEGLKAKGFQEGQNLSFLVRNTRGNMDILESVVKELLAEKPDIIYSISTPVTTQVLKTAGNQFPIVFNIVGDPIGAGFAKSYPIPDTNLTGCSNLSAELSGKRLEIFKEAFPDIKKVITFYNPDNKFSQISIENARRAAPILNIGISEVFTKDKNSLAQALAEIPENEFDGIFITPDAMVISNIDLITKRSLELKIPTMGHEQTLAEKGVTLTYGANFYNMGVQCSSVAASILSGRKPQTTPVLTPDKLDLVVNLKNIEMMGLAISEKIPKEANEVIR